MHVQIVATGGTIDKIYFDAASDYQIGEPAALSLLDSMKVGFSYEVSSLLRKDSLEMTDTDRTLIASHVADLPHARIVITHGTDTMVATAQALKSIADKTIVLVGAMLPAIVMHSDAAFNLGFACAAAQLLPPGVYIAMNGEIFDPDQVRKCRESMRFIGV